MLNETFFLIFKHRGRFKSQLFSFLASLACYQMRRSVEYHREQENEKWMAIMGEGIRSRLSVLLTLIHDNSHHHQWMKTKVDLFSHIWFSASITNSIRKPVAG